MKFCIVLSRMQYFVMYMISLYTPLSIFLYLPNIQVIHNTFTTSAGMEFTLFLYGASFGYICWGLFIQNYDSVKALYLSQLILICALIGNMRVTTSFWFCIFRFIQGFAISASRIVYTNLFKQFLNDVELQMAIGNIMLLRVVILATAPFIGSIIGKKLIVGWKGIFVFQLVYVLLTFILALRYLRDVPDDTTQYLSFITYYKQFFYDHLTSKFTLANSLSEGAIGVISALLTILISKYYKIFPYAFSSTMFIIMSNVAILLYINIILSKKTSLQKLLNYNLVQYWFFSVLLFLISYNFHPLHYVITIWFVSILISSLLVIAFCSNVCVLQYTTASNYLSTFIGVSEVVVGSLMTLVSSFFSVNNITSFTFSLVLLFLAVFMIYVYLVVNDV